MSVILLIVFISISYLIVRIGAIALELTGMERAKAAFRHYRPLPTRDLPRRKQNLSSIIPKGGGLSHGS